MASNWGELAELIGSREFLVSEAAIKGTDITIQGAFELPPLARLTFEDQVFVSQFVKAHGSIKQMEKDYGVSYPTVKARLNRISEKMDFVEFKSPKKREEVLQDLETGKISAQEAIKKIKAL